MTIFLCDDTMEGIFTAVYDAWASRLGHANVKLQVRGGTMELFADYREAETDMEKAEKVARTIKRELGEEGWKQISRAALAFRKERADAIYRILVLALPEGRKRKGADILAQIQNPSVCLIMELSRSVWHETHRYMGFIRFRELQSGVLFSEIAPENQVLPLLADHFADRLPNEDFLIYDRAHDRCLLHRRQRPCVLVRDVRPDTSFSDREEEIQRLWLGFCRSISIEARENPALQQQMLPLRFRKWMTEEQNASPLHPPLNAPCI